jgi:hypothetical protein
LNPLLEKPAPRRKGFFAGGEIDAWCTRCKLDLGHRIVALVDSRPKRVVCMTCGSEHNYRSPKAAESAPGKRATSSGSAPRSSTGTKASAAKGSSEKAKGSSSARTWETRTSGHAPTAFTRYSMELTFAADQLVTHKKFGEGYVVSVSDDKVTIAFRDGERTLVHKKA